MKNKTVETQTSRFVFDQKLRDAGKFVSSLGSNVPRRAVYWSIGAAVLGAAAVAAIMYRARLTVNNLATPSNEKYRTTEADPDFADFSVGRQSSAFSANRARADFQNLQTGSHH